MLVLYTFEADWQRSTAQRKTAALAKADVAMTAPRILLADDHQEMMQTLVGMLEDEFQIVGTAENGMRALELAASLTPDIVVLDISMPEVNGIEAAWRLREEGSLARVVFLTAHNDPDMVKAAMSAGALGYVLKSHLATDLVSAIWQALVGKTFISPAITPA
jgi:DNA-binding NarL/FixJ family response regulator